MNTVEIDSGVKPLHSREPSTDRRSRQQNGAAGHNGHPALTAKDLAALENTLPVFLTAAQVQELFGTKETGTRDLMRAMGALTLGKDRLLRVPRARLLEFLRQRMEGED